MGERPVQILDHSLAVPCAEPVFGGLAKRSVDIVVSVAALVILAPVLLAIALAVKVQDGGPVLFIQPRVGLHGIEFPFLKFRSMTLDASAQFERLIASNPAAACEWRLKQKLEPDPRVTGVGCVLRRTSLDELPQFLNVLLGHMSVVGPRPILRAQVESYSAGYERYCAARPGLTGLWQVSGRSATTFSRRSALDQVYLRRWSFWGDLLLILRTFGAVVRQSGAC